ncbi:MAG: heme-copper oxidase subunit III [Methylovirgula sp.]
MTDMTAAPPALPIGSVDRRASGWYGMLCVIATEGALFGYLLFAYFYCAVQFPSSWSPEPYPPFTFALPATIAMLLSSGAIWWGERSLARRALPEHRIGLALAGLLGVVFLVLEGLEWKSKPFALTTNLYGSLYFTITGFDALHVIFGIAAILAVLTWSLLGYIDYRRNTPVLIISAYWHFVTAVWIAIFFTFYIAPYLR